MKFNDRELASLAGQPADKEGRLNHKGTSHRDGYREKWFKLKGNMLFYYRLNEYGAVPNQEKPDGLFVIEHCRIQLEPRADMPFVFSIIFPGDQEKKHYFSGPTQRHCEQWVKTLRSASYESMRYHLQQLKLLLEKLTGKDPLKPYGNKVQFQHSSLKAPNIAQCIPRNNSGEYFISGDRSLLETCESLSDFWIPGNF